MKTEYLQFLGVYQFIIGLGVGALLVFLIGRTHVGYYKKRMKFYFQLWVDTQQELFLNERKMEDAQLELSCLHSCLKEKIAGSPVPKEEDNANGTMSGLEN